MADNGKTISLSEMLEAIEKGVQIERMNTVKVMLRLMKEGEIDKDTYDWVAYRRVTLEMDGEVEP